MRKYRSPNRPSFIELLEARRLLATLLGTPGDDNIIISFDPVTRDATVTGASNFADGTVFPASTENNHLSFFIDAGDGNDRIEIGAEPSSGFVPPVGGNILGGAGDDTLIGGNGHDNFHGGPGNDTIVGGYDMLWFTDATHGVHLNLEKGIVFDDGTGGTDQISGIRSVHGSEFDDRIYGGGLRNGGSFNGGGGNDLLVVSNSSPSFGLWGDLGDDTLIGGPGADTFNPGSGNDRIFGGGGNDLLEYNGHGYILEAGQPVLRFAHARLIRLDLGLVEDDGYGGRDIVRNVHNLYVDSAANDTIYGDAHDNDILSRRGIDVIYGLEGNDHLEIDQGSLLGGHGNDHLAIDQGILLGGHGNDRLDTRSSLVLIKGGPGADQINLWGPKYPIERIWMGVGDTLIDNRLDPNPADAVPVNNLQLPPREQPTPPSPNLKYVWYLRRWVLE